jgi:hypothetical protein
LEFFQLVGLLLSTFEYQGKQKITEESLFGSPVVTGDHLSSLSAASSSTDGDSLVSSTGDNNHSGNRPRSMELSTDGLGNPTAVTYIDDRAGGGSYAPSGGSVESPELSSHGNSKKEKKEKKDKKSSKDKASSVGSNDSGSKHTTRAHRVGSKATPMIPRTDTKVHSCVNDVCPH